MSQAKQQSSAISNQAVKARWNTFAPAYSKFDCTMQTFYYSLVNMLKIGQAEHILEIASGTGKLIPYALTLKRPQCTYLASDICENMIDLSKSYLAHYLHKLGVTMDTEEWMKRQNLEYQVLDGEKPIKTEYKFDRIICNLVLMITQDPKRMMQNLASVAAQGCLLGVTVWGDKSQSNLMVLPEAGLKQLGLPIPKIRQNFHLYNKLEPLANQTGWQVIIQWDQNAPFRSIDIDEDIKAIAEDVSKGNQKLSQFVINEVAKILEKKQALNFPTQMAILRKK